MNDVYGLLESVSAGRDRKEKILRTRGIVITNRCLMNPLCSYCNYPTTERIETSVDEAVKSAGDLISRGADRVTLVAGWLGREYMGAVPYIRAIKREFPDLHLNAALGPISKGCLSEMYCAGLDQYGCNVESVPRILEIIKGHDDFEERIDTLLAARDAGLKISSGFILGVGEAEKDISYLLERILGIGAESVFISPFIPYENTGMAGWSRPTFGHVISALAMVRKAAGKRAVGFRILRNGNFYPVPMISLAVYAGASMLAPILDDYPQTYGEVLDGLCAFDGGMKDTVRKFAQYGIPSREAEDFFRIHSTLFY